MRSTYMTLTAIEQALEISRAKGMTEQEQADRLPFRIIRSDDDGFSGEDEKAPCSAGHPAGALYGLPLG